MGFPLPRKLTRIRLDQFLEKYAFGGPALDVGGAHSPYRKWFPRLQSLDISQHRGADIIGDAHDMHMIADSSYQIVLCTSVLEHCLEPRLVVSELRRVLKEDGLLLLSVPFMFPIHDAPSDYWRFTRFGIQQLLKDFEIVELVEDLDTLETLGYTYHRLYLQTRGPLFLLRAVSLLLSRLFYQIPKGLLGREYGDVSKKYQMDGHSILAANYLICARKSDAGTKP